MKIIVCLAALFGMVFGERSAAQSGIADTAGRTACPDSLLYGGRAYHSVIIGGQCWLKENLDVGVMIDSSEDMEDNDVIEKYCYRNDPANCAAYGGLYTWDEAMRYADEEDPGGICPAGWHIPTMEALRTLWTSMKERRPVDSSLGFPVTRAGMVITEFSGMLAGVRHSDGEFHGLGDYGDFWASSEGDGMTVASWDWMISRRSGPTSRYYLYPQPQTFNNNENVGFSVRCIKD